MTQTSDRGHAGMWLLMVIALSPSVASAQSATIVAGIEHALARTPVYNSGATVEVPLIIEGMAACHEVKAVLAQQTLKLTAVLDEKIALDCAAVQGDVEATLSSIEFSFTTPEVKRVTAFVWEFMRCEPDQSCETLGSFAFTALPADLLEPIRTWSAENAIYLDDKAGHLAAFLDLHAIEYVESSRKLAKDAEVIALVIRSDPRPKDEMSANIFE